MQEEFVEACADACFQRGDVVAKGAGLRAFDQADGKTYGRADARHEGGEAGGEVWPRVTRPVPI